MKRIYFHGELRDRLGEYRDKAVVTVNDAFRALNATTAGFKDAINELSERGLQFRIWNDDGDEFGPGELAYPCGTGALHIAPVIAGASSKGVLKTIAGIVIVAASMYYRDELGSSSNQIAQFGVMLTLSGISEMTTAAPKKGPENRSGFGFGGTEGITASGIPVPIVYGRTLCEGIPVNVQMTIVDQQFYSPLSGGEVH